MAENLARAGVPVALCSAVGNDEDGRALIAHLSRAGVDVSGVVLSEEYPTSSYTAIVGPDGTLLAGASDTEAIDALSLRDLERWWAEIQSAAWLFADCNLPSQLLAACVDRRRFASWRLAVDGTSVAKARRLPNDLSSVDVLFVNEDESAAITSRAQFTIVSRGAAGALVIPSERDAVEIAAVEAAPVDTTGAGDALAAGSLHALLRGERIEEAVQSGMQLAARAVETHGAIPSLR